VPAVLFAAQLGLGTGCLLRSTFSDAPAEGLRIERDIAYHQGEGFDDAKHRLDLYEPDTPGPHPVVVFVHGGGWVFGDRHWFADAYGKLGRRLAHHGILAAVISYRLAPKFKHPAQIEDVARAVSWVLSHAAEHGGDPSRVFLMGHSAGAQMVALAATDPRWLRAQGADPRQLAGVVAISGPYDVAHCGRSTLLCGLPMVIPAFGRNPAVWRDASPAEHLRDAPAPPFLVAYADADPPLLREDGRRFSKALHEAGVPATELEVPWRDHFTDIADWGLPGDPLAEATLSFVAHAKPVAPSVAVAPR
jgi:acetyl esterase/lipase